MGSLNASYCRTQGVSFSLSNPAQRLPSFIISLKTEGFKYDKLSKHELQLGTGAYTHTHTLGTHTQTHTKHTQNQNVFLYIPGPCFSRSAGGDMVEARHILKSFGSSFGFIPVKHPQGKL